MDFRVVLVAVNEIAAAPGAGVGCTCSLVYFFVPWFIFLFLLSLRFCGARVAKNGFYLYFPTVVIKGRAGASASSFKRENLKKIIKI